MNDPYKKPGGHPMRRFTVFAAAFTAIVLAGTLPWPHQPGIFRSHNSHDPQVVDAALDAARDGWTTDACSGENSDHTGWGWGDPARVCEARTITIATPGTLDVAGDNGGIHVIGEDRHDVKIEARVEGWAHDKSEARSIVDQVKVTTANGIIRDDGPRSHWGNRGYSVGYVIHTPRQLSATLKTANGGISLQHLEGDLAFDTVNGGVDLSDLAGHAHGSTINGGLDISLSGNAWRGEGLDAHTTNGGVTLNIPEDYSAHLETGTINGGIEVGFPVRIQGQIKHNLSTDIGHGGSTIHAETVNGGIVLSRSDKGNQPSHGDESDGDAAE